jgi:hypothetical protein
VRQPKFEGHCEDLKGHIFDCSDACQADVYTKMVKEIATYISSTYKYGADAKITMETLAHPTLNKPMDPHAEASQMQCCIWEKRVNEFVKREINLEENIKWIYLLAWGQCTDALHAKLEVLPTYEHMSTNAVGLELLQSIKDIVYNFQDQHYLPHSIYEGKCHLYAFQQGKYMNTQAYLELFQNMIDVIEHCSGSIGLEPGICDMIMSENGWTSASAMNAQKDKSGVRHMIGTWPQPSSLALIIPDMES